MNRLTGYIRHRLVCRANARWLAQVCADDDRRAEQVIDLVELEQERQEAAA